MMNSQRGYTIFDSLSFIVIFSVAVVGARYAYMNFGFVGGLAGAAIGGGIGLFLGRLPYAILSWSIQRYFKNKSSEVIRAYIHKGDHFVITHILLANLMVRGESIIDELPFVLDLMKSDSLNRRQHGWLAFRLSYPELLPKLNGYSPKDAAEKCRSIVSNALFEEETTARDKSVRQENPE